MRGLALADRILSGEDARAALAAEAEKRRAAVAATAQPDEEMPLAAPAVRSTEVAVVEALPAPDAAEHVLPELDLAEIWKWLNPHMLYAKHLGLRGSYRKLKEAGDPKLAELEAVIAKVQAAGWIRARAMYRYFGASSEGNTLHVAVPGRRRGVLHLSASGRGRTAVPRGLRASAGGGRRRLDRVLPDDGRGGRSAPGPRS